MAKSIKKPATERGAELPISKVKVIINLYLLQGSTINYCKYFTDDENSSDLDTIL